jgi:antitoxin (DNA-binding transcriptional repressor) of toxin-antitoxin stability system
VGLRELKNRLSEYVRRAASGEFVMVTDRGRVVAELRPPEASPDHLLREAIALGTVRLGLPNHRPEVYALPPLSLPQGTVETLLDDLRSDR